MLDQRGEEETVHHPSAMETGHHRRRGEEEDDGCDSGNRRREREDILVIAQHVTICRGDVCLLRLGVTTVGFFLCILLHFSLYFCFPVENEAEKEMADSNRRIRER